MKKNMISTKKLEPALRERGLVLEKSPEGGIALTPLYISRPIHPYEEKDIEASKLDALLDAHRLKLKFRHGEPTIENEK